MESECKSLFTQTCQYRSSALRFHSPAGLWNQRLLIKFMPNKKLSCKTGLKKYVIRKDVFEREIELCKKLSKENKGGCNWGKCKDCGVLLLLRKLYKGKLVEDKNEIKKIKKDIVGI